MAKRKANNVPSDKLSKKVKTNEIILQPVLFDGNVHYINDAERCQEFSEKLLMERYLGFDIEWRATFTRGEAQRPAALIQLSKPGACYLFHVIHYEMSEGLRYILESRNFVKVGVGIRGDFIKLAKDYDIQYDPYGVRNLSAICNTKLPPDYHKNWNLAALTAQICKQELGKPKNIRCGNWEETPLSEMQKTYAATDAWIGLKLWHIMRKMDRYDEEDAPLVSDIEFQIPIPPIFTKPTHESFELLPRLRPKHRDVYNCWYHFGFTVEEICHFRRCRPKYVWYLIWTFVKDGFPYRFSQLKLGSLFGKVSTAKRLMFPGDKLDFELEDFQKLFDKLNIQDPEQQYKLKISVAHSVRLMKAKLQKLAI